MAAVGASQTRVRVLGSKHSVDITSPIVAEGREGSAMAGGIPERVFNSAYEMSQNCQKFTSLRIWITSGTRTPPQQCSGLVPTLPYRVGGAGGSPDWSVCRYHDS